LRNKKEKMREFENTQFFQTRIFRLGTDKSFDNNFIEIKEIALVGG